MTVEEKLEYLGYKQEDNHFHKLDWSFEKVIIVDRGYVKEYYVEEYYKKKYKSEEQVDSFGADAKKVFKNLKREVELVESTDERYFHNTYKVPYEVFLMTTEELVERYKEHDKYYKKWESCPDGSAGAYFHDYMEPLADELKNRNFDWKTLLEEKDNGIDK